MSRANLLFCSVMLLVTMLVTVPAHSEEINYSYDELGRLKQVSYENGYFIAYSYDALGARVQKIVQSFDIQVTELGAVPCARPGGEAILSAQITNNSGTALQTGDELAFWVEGPGLTGGWVGSVSVAGLPSGESDWYSAGWAIPAGRETGVHTYRAQAWRGAAALSPLSAARNFTVTLKPCATTLESPTGDIRTLAPPIPGTPTAHQPGIICG